ncbi:DUF5994 family protein [Streptomyces sp. CG1]|uniref:DUF5994 family protein n=1 Tax=Streptomyces sp. CG1 TaxID=1287523 RepID=UPI0034E26FAB
MRLTRPPLLDHDHDHEQEQEQEQEQPTVPRAFRAALPTVPFLASDETGSRPAAPGTGPRPCAAPELELPSPIGSLEPDPGTTVRVTVGPAEWPDAPHTVMPPGREIAVEPAGSGSAAHVIILACGTVGRRTCWSPRRRPPNGPPYRSCPRPG